MPAIVLTARDVRAIVATVNTTKTWSRRDAWYLRVLQDKRLKAASKGELTLAPEVYLPLSKVVEYIWRARTIAHATWDQNVREDKREAEAKAKACPLCAAPMSVEERERLSTCYHCHRVALGEAVEG